jgi:PAS domain S-box-containing protein
VTFTISDKPNDLVEKNIVQDKLKQSEQHYRLLFENNPLPAWIFDVGSHQFLEVNQAAIEFYGYSRDEFLSMKIWDIRPKEEITFLEEDLKRIKENKKQLQRVWKHRKRNGEIIYVEIRANGFIYNNRTARLVMVNDVTAKEKAEASLKKSNERYRLATRASFDAIWDVDILTDTINWGDGYQALFGYKLEDEEAPRSSWTNHIHPDDKDHMIQLNQDVLNDPAQNFINSEYRFIRADNSVAYVIDRGIIIRDENGKPLRMVGAMRDITEQKYQQDIQLLELKIFEISATQGIPFRDVINSLLQGVEAIHPEMYSSVLLLMKDNTIKNLAGPRLPEEYLQMIDGLPIGPGAGSCGTAMYRKEPVIVSDIDHDPLWAPYLPITQRFGLKACWAVPIIHNNGEVMGSFAIYYHQPKSPSEKEWNTILRLRNFMRLLLENNISFEQIKQSNERYDIVTNATHDLIWDWNLETNELYRDPKGLLKVYGYSSNEPINNINNWLKQVHPEDLPKVQNAIFNIVNTKEENIFDVEYRFKKEDNNYAHIYDRGYILRNAEGKAYRMIGAAQDITERKKLEQELLNQQKAISQATINTQEKERAEISKELHDNVNQVLTTTKLYLDLATTNPELKDELIAKSSKNVINAIAEIKQLSQSLMIPSLGDLGLADSIEDLIENINATKKITAVFLCEEIDENILNENQKLTLFRIVQEALNNIVRHAEATETIIELSIQKSIFKLIIKDNGKGFDPTSVKNGAGLNNIRNRVYLLNGNLTLDTQPGKGCTLVVQLPHLI